MVSFQEFDVKVLPCVLLGLQRAGVFGSWGRQLLLHVRLTLPGHRFLMHDLKYQ